jgi:hypothetical protein
VALRQEIEMAHRSAEQTLDSRGLKAETKRARIEGIHNRLTQNLVVHLGVIMMEVEREKGCTDGEGLVGSNACRATDSSTCPEYGIQSV